MGTLRLIFNSYQDLERDCSFNLMHNMLMLLMKFSGIIKILLDKYGAKLHTSSYFLLKGNIPVWLVWRLNMHPRRGTAAVRTFYRAF
jgi:hypothetical protein